MTTELVRQMRGIALLIGVGAFILAIAIGPSWSLVITVAVCGTILSFTSFKTTDFPSEILSSQTRCALAILIHVAFWGSAVSLMTLVALGGSLPQWPILRMLVVPMARARHLCSVTSLKELANEIGLIVSLTIVFLSLANL